MKSRFQLSRKKWENIKYTQQLPHDQLEAQKDELIVKSLQVNSNWFKQILGDNDDFVTRKFMIFGSYPAALFYLSDFADQQSLNQDILKPLMSVPTHLLGKNIDRDTLQDTLMNEVLYHSKVVINNKKVELVQSILKGETIIIIDGVQKAFQIGTRKVEKRAINQPETEQVILGPREGFIETLSTNISLLRYRLQTPDFIVKTLNVGEMTKSKVAICFVRGLAGEELIKEVEYRLSKIDIDGILDVGYIEQFIEDNHMSPFPQVQSTERPDKAVGGILEGRVAIMVDGSPFALLVPVVFNQFYQTAEDYSSLLISISVNSN